VKSADKQHPASVLQTAIHSRHDISAHNDRIIPLLNSCFFPFFVIPQSST